MDRFGGVRLMVGLAAVMGDNIVRSGEKDQPSPIRSDETVVLFPTAAHWNEVASGWDIPIHGWVLECERDSYIRSMAIRQVARHMRLKDDDRRWDHLRNRMHWLLADGERGKRVMVEVLGQRVICPATGADGQFRGELTVRRPARTGANWPAEAVEARVVLGEGDERSFATVVHLNPPSGWSVVSDIDDTIKVTEVLDRAKLLANTLVEPFRAVDGMPELYQAWARQGAAFHYVSRSPWQLFPPLREFLEQAGFPSGSFHLTEYRLSATNLLSLLNHPPDQKRQQIVDLLERYPRRKFLLVGDSSQGDPELYGELARGYPQQVERIEIRLVAHSRISAERWERAFRGLHREKWHLFWAAGEVGSRLGP